MGTKQMYVAQVGVASIFLSGSGQLYLRSVEQLYSVPTMAIDYLFKAGYNFRLATKKYLVHWPAFLPRSVL